jgi:sialidase-1
MAAIEVVDDHVVYENPQPQNRARHGYFPGLVQLPSGELLALFTLGEAFEAADVTTVVTRSPDQGRTWNLEGPLHQKDDEHRYNSDYLKPTLLENGRLIAMGFCFHRTNPDQTITNPDPNSDGLRDGDNLVSFSEDGGHAWSHPRIITRTRPELIEHSGPAIQLRSGVLLGAGSLFPRWDGSNPSGFVGALLQSQDGGKTWDDQTNFFKDPGGRYAPAEPRLCEMQDDRIVSLNWMLDHVNGTNLTNHMTVSHDGGATWSGPIDTGVLGQASNLMHWADDMLLTIHCHREGEDIGLFVRIVDFAADQWRTVKEVKIWGNAPSRKVASYATMGQNLRFGQASLLRLDNDDILATHWAIEEGQGRIRSHRLRVQI